MTSQELEEYSMQKHDNKQVVIQITSTGHPEPFLMPYKYNNIQDTLFLEFNDVINDDPFGQYAKMTVYEARAIHQFFLKHVDDADVLIVAQDKTRQRATGVVKALADFYSQDIDYILEDPKYTINTCVYDTLTKYLEQTN